MDVVGDYKTFITNSRFSFIYSCLSGVPAITLGPPPCIFKARTVATNTTALGVSPDDRHFILKNFSMPISAPNPASVTTYPFSPTSFKAILSARMEEFP